MLSLKSGFPFATVSNKIVYVNDNEEADDTSFLGKLVDIGKERKFQFIPPNDSFRLCIFGSAGSGKSTFVAGLLSEYKKKFKKNKIFMISPTSDDEAYKDLQKTIEYIKIDDSLLVDPMNFTEFDNCIIVFDDSEMLSANKELNKAIDLFRNQCLENGRKRKISVVVINHVAMNGAQTKKILNECHLTVVFPKSNFASVTRLAKAYWGFSKEQIEYLRTVPSRYCVIKSSYPQAILSEHQIKVL
ncbi:MAG: DUF87 domain-containing protein [Bacteroidetes bacterium]|nr:DUF87 domain-containing protein [Bacteroidota bacterium]